MGSVLMFCSIRSIAESFRTTRKFAHIRFLSSMRSKMSFQVLQPTVSFPASLERAFMRFFSSMSSHVNDQHVLSFERLLLSIAFLPLTHKALLVGVYVIVGDVLDQVFLGPVFFITVGPVAVSLDEVRLLLAVGITVEVPTHGASFQLNLMLFFVIHGAGDNI